MPRGKPKLQVLRINRPRLRFDLRRLVGMRIGRTLVRPVEQGSNPPLSHSCDATGPSLTGLERRTSLRRPLDTVLRQTMRSRARSRRIGPQASERRQSSSGDPPLFVRPDKTGRLPLRVASIQLEKRGFQFSMLNGNRAITRPLLEHWTLGGLAIGCFCIATAAGMSGKLP